MSVPGSDPCRAIRPCRGKPIACPAATSSWLPTPSPSPAPKCCLTRGDVVKLPVRWDSRDLCELTRGWQQRKRRGFFPSSSPPRRALGACRGGNVNHLTAAQLVLESERAVAGHLSH